MAGSSDDSVIAAIKVSGLWLLRAIKARCSGSLVRVGDRISRIVAKVSRSIGSVS